MDAQSIAQSVREAMWRGDHVLLAPPFIIADGEIDTLVERLRRAVDLATGAAG